MNVDSVTQTEVQGAQTESPAAEKTLSPRDQKLRELSEGRRDEVAAEIAEFRGEAAPVTEEAPTVEQTAAPAAPGTEIKERDGKRYVTLKVNGKEQEVTLEDVLKRAQKDVAADIRLQQASERERNARIVEAQAEAMRRQLTQELASLKTIPQNTVTELDSSDVDATIENLYKGDLDKAKDGLRKLLTGRQPATPAVSAEAVAASVRESLRLEQAAARKAEYESDLVTALNVFNEEFADIAGNEQLLTFADVETTRIAAQNPSLTPLEVMRKAGQNIRNLVKPTVAVTQTQLREQAKANLPRAVTGVRASAPGPQVAETPTASSIVNAMRRARGQPTAS